MFSLSYLNPCLPTTVKNSSLQPVIYNLLIKKFSAGVIYDT